MRVHCAVVEVAGLNTVGVRIIPPWNQVAMGLEADHIVAPFGIDCHPSTQVHERHGFVG